MVGHCYGSCGSYYSDSNYITQDDTFHFTSGSNGSIKTNIQIDKTGKYYFAVRNNENETVEVLGYVYY